MGFLKDLDDRNPFDRIDRAIKALRDEIAEYNFTVSKGHGRTLSLCVAKLDEAAGLAIQAGIETGRFVVVDRKEMLRPVEDRELTTVTTDQNGSA